MPPFLPSPQFSLSDAPFLGAQGSDQPPLLPIGVGPCLGTGPEPYFFLWPFLLSWSVPPMSRSGLSHPENQNTGPKENLEHRQLVHLLVHLPVPSQATSLAAQGAGVVGISLGPLEMLQQPGQAPHSESWRAQVYYSEP